MLLQQASITPNSPSVFTTSSSTHEYPETSPCNGKHASVEVLHKKKGRSYSNNDTGISPAGKVLLRIVASCLSNYCQARGIPPEQQQCGIRPARSTVRRAVRRTVITRARMREGSSFVPHASSICRKRTALSTNRRYDRTCQRRYLLAVNHQIYDDMWGRVRTDHGEHSE